MKILPLPHHIKFAQIRGFSLVELSIVLVILGLLAGGIMGGRVLIRAAELRSVISEFQQLQTAIHSFQGKYFALPGDMRDAPRFWGEATGGICSTVAANTHSAALEGGTCGGDGDGVIAPQPHLYESFLAWQHLQRAGMISGKYSGVRGVLSSFDHVAGVNAPSVRYDRQAVWVIRGGVLLGSENIYYEMDYGHFLAIGRVRTTEDGHPWGLLMTPADAWSVDGKMDDGKPAKGMVIAYPHSNNCTTSQSNSDLQGEYQLDKDEVLCGLIFRHAF